MAVTILETTSGGAEGLVRGTSQGSLEFRKRHFSSLAAIPE
jgi:hypothetical protein